MRLQRSFRKIIVLTIIFVTIVISFVLFLNNRQPINYTVETWDCETTQIVFNGNNIKIFDLKTGTAFPVIEEEFKIGDKVIDTVSAEGIDTKFEVHHIFKDNYDKDLYIRKWRERDTNNFMTVYYMFPKKNKVLFAGTTKYYQGIFLWCDRRFQ